MSRHHAPAFAHPSLSGAQSLCEVFQRTATVAADRPALRRSDGGPAITWGDYAAHVRRIAEGLVSLGVQRGDTVALMLSNSPEFHLVDMAIMHVGATPFSIYNTSSPEQVGYLLSNSDARIVVTERQRLQVIAASGAAIHTTVCVDGSIDGALSLDELERRTVEGFDFAATRRAVCPDDIATLIYTSGTTGPPKGVELTHGALLAALSSGHDIASIAAGSREGRLISYLPDAHVANRFFGHYLALVDGACIATVADLKQMADALPQVRPTVFLAVPALWTKLKASVEQSVAAQTGARGRLAAWALRVGRRATEQRLAGRRSGILLSGQRWAADLLVLRRVRQKLGLDRARAVITGAAPIAPEVLTFFLGLGIELCEGWGMSETAAAGAINVPGGIRRSTVGRPMKGLEMRLADDGELLVRGPTLMRGYRNDPIRTAEAIDADGWLHTGDIGRIDADGYVSIIDRKKDLIINAAGKNMSPANIENAVLALCPLVGSVIVVGDARPYLVALVTLDETAASHFARAQGSGGDQSLAALAGDPAIVTEVTEGVARANSRLSRVEQIKSFRILTVPWAPGGDELTPTHKLKRRVIVAKYADEIDALYNSAATAAPQVRGDGSVEASVR